MTPRPHQSTNNELASALSNLAEEVAALRNELRPVADAYKAATLGAQVLKWGIGVLASVAAIWAFWKGAPNL